jgi:hypothetical protein
MADGIEGKRELRHTPDPAFPLGASGPDRPRQLLTPNAPAPTCLVLPQRVSELWKEAAGAPLCPPRRSLLIAWRPLVSHQDWRRPRR